MKIQFPESEIQLLKDLIKTRNHFNQTYLQKSQNKEDPNQEKHLDHFNKETELLMSISKKLEGNKCQLGKCKSDLVATVLTFNSANDSVLICETCAWILEIKERDQLPKETINLDLYYHDMKF